MNAFYVQRMNSGVARVRKTYTRKDGSIYDRVGTLMLGEVGTPDIMAFKVVINWKESEPKYRLLLLFVEVKRPGNKPTIHQEHKMRELTEYGAICMVAHSSIELQEKLSAFI